MSTENIQKGPCFFVLYPPDSSTASGFQKIFPLPFVMSAIAASNITSGPSTYEVQATSHPLIQAALARLSNEDRNILAEFKEEFPSLVPEKMAKVANSFMLYRSLYVQKAKEEDANGNQADYSRDAAVYWKNSVADSEKARYRKWHFRVRAVWKKMYPNGFPSVITKEKKKRNVKKVKKPTSSRPSSYRKFQPLPSPPVSEDAYFSARSDSEEICDSASEDDPKDNDEYCPEKPSRKRNSRRSQPEQCFKFELLTPVSMVRELSLDRSSRSPSPMPAFCDSDANFPKPVLKDVNLFELNGDYPSTFTGSLIFSSLPSNVLHPQEAGAFSEPTAAGYGLDCSLGKHTALIAWDETNVPSDSEIYMSLSCVPSPLCPDLLYADDFSISTDELVDALAQDL